MSLDNFTVEAGKRSVLYRYGWKLPVCKSHESCKCGGPIGGGGVRSGEIIVGPGNQNIQNTWEDENDYSLFTNTRYTTRTNCLWTINVPKGHSIKMQFDKEYGFDVEYHAWCGFDKVHIFSGHPGENTPFKRIARFCGPRRDTATFGNIPHDGAWQLVPEKINKNTGNREIPFWDWPYEANTHKVTIGWDSDQSHVKKGFKLKWWAVPNVLESFDTLEGALHLISKKIIPAIREQPTVPAPVKTNQIKHLNALLSKLESAITNKGPTGSKACTEWDSWVPPSKLLKETLDQEHALEYWLARDGPIVKYAKYYIGACRNYNWPKRVNNIWKKTTKKIGRARVFGGGRM